VAAPEGVSVQRPRGDNDACGTLWTLECPCVCAQFRDVGTAGARAVEELALLQVVSPLCGVLHTQDTASTAVEDV
jgi:hypothetical protein